MTIKYNKMNLKSKIETRIQNLEKRNDKLIEKIDWEDEYGWSEDFKFELDINKNKITYLHGQLSLLNKIYPVIDNWNNDFEAIKKIKKIIGY